ncbi:metal ABC transporter permease [Clostridium bowmanii]|uniref:metal ABC transporter permease n=1 Tax=Clostridium bowmanii TaxID=132925 RepID=UPI001C0CB412|nr:metal ABC transporter permease [Clostridium bowmanii]MBU3190855.1 metal ABC transporter permease [Clostridium bowmanii]MCA1075241.1 metal ABC transporter permease [Clostridium bowmanii]
MSIWYNIVDFLLPFDWAHYTFMKNALLGVLLVTPMFGLLGTMVVNNKMAFFADALGHSALTGIAIGVILGIKNPIWSMLAFSLLLAVVITKVKNVNTSSTDTIIGVFSSTAVALGVVMLSFGGGFTKYSVYLIGDLLSISKIDLIILPIIFVVVVIIWVISFNKLLLVSVNPLLARSRGVNVDFYENLFTITVAVIVTISIQWVGVLIISSMLVLPAAAARNISSNMRQYHVYSIAIALISGISGLILSYFLGSASGATMVLISSVFFAITFFMKIKIYS